MIVKLETNIGNNYIGDVRKVNVDKEPDFQEPFSGRVITVNNYEQRDIYITTATEKLSIRTNGDAYLLNDEGKTIDRI